MRILGAAAAFVLALTLASTAVAQDVAVTTAAPTGGGGFKPFVVGGYMSFGMAHTFYAMDGEDPDTKPRFAGGGGGYFDWYLMEILALQGGIGFIGKGWRYDEHDVKYRMQFIYMEIPLGAKLNIKGFQAAVEIALSFALSERTHQFEPDDDVDHFGDDEWDYYRRFNLVPRVTVGYAIPVGPVAIVPSLMWSIELINSAKGDMEDALDAKIHNMNLMGNVGVEFGFGG